MPEEREARMALNCVVEPGEPALAGLLADFTPGELWKLVSTGSGLDGVVGAWRRRAATLGLRQVEGLARRHGLRFVVPEDPEWPEQLAVLDTCEPVQRLRGAPVGLWVAGARHLGESLLRSVSVVGSRASTAYGDRVASDWAAELASGGTTVLSGGAYGIDAAAHRGALAEDGCTVAVLANGLDELYPRAHVGLLGSVRETGVLVSEYPPGEHPTRLRFLARNRLVAALTQATVIVEAAARSGARNTATWAGVCGRPVAAVPGPVWSAQSYTPHRLVREGEAVLVASVAQLLELVGPLGEGDERPPQPRLLDALTPDELAVYEALPARGPRDTGALALRAGVTIPQALAALGSLVQAGFVTASADGRWKLGPVENRPLRAVLDEE